MILQGEVKYKNENENHFKNEQRSRDAAAPKRAKSSRKKYYYYEDIYIYTSLQQQPLTTPIDSTH